MCDQQSLRSACTYAQSDQSLCKSLEYYMIVKLLTEHHLEFLSLKGGCRGLSESTHVKMPPCWKSHATAQLCHSISTIADVKWPHSNVEIDCFAVLFVMMLYIPVNNFSVMSPCLLLCTNEVSCSRTQLSASGESQTSGLLIPTLALFHWATVLQTNSSCWENEEVASDII